jgi:branched-chain amino acid transport system permease protein
LNLLFPAIVSGIAIGLLYGLMALSIVVLYKATGVANFAQGNVVTFTTIATYMFTQPPIGLPFVEALALGVVAAGGLGAVIYFVAIRPAENAGILNIVTRTLAVYLLLYGIITWFWGANQPFPFPSLFPQTTVEILGSYVSIASFGIMGVFAVIAALLWIWFRFTTTGLLMRATAERPSVALTLGVPTRRLSVVAWVASAVLALIVGVLATPSLLLTSDMGNELLIFAFAGAAIGGLTSMPGCVVGGIVVGVIGNVAATYLNTDVSTIAVFALLVLSLVLRPNGLFGGAIVERL